MTQQGNQIDNLLNTGNGSIEDFDDKIKKIEALLADHKAALAQISDDEEEPEVEGLDAFDSALASVPSSLSDVDLSELFSLSEAPEHLDTVELAASDSLEVASSSDVQIDRELASDNQEEAEQNLVVAHQSDSDSKAVTSSDSVADEVEEAYAAIAAALSPLPPSPAEVTQPTEVDETSATQTSSEVGDLSTLKVSYIVSDSALEPTRSDLTSELEVSATTTPKLASSKTLLDQLSEKQSSTQTGISTPDQGTDSLPTPSKKGNKALIAGISAGVILVAAGAVGVYAWQQHQSTSPKVTMSSTSQSQSSSQPISSESSSQVSSSSSQPQANSERSKQIEELVGKTPDNRPKLDPNINGTEPAFKWPEGMKETFIKEMQNRKYITGDNYKLVPAEVIGDKGIYNLYDDKGTYLVSINAQTGNFIGTDPKDSVDLLK